MSDWTREEQKAHRAELVAALRSGKFKQGKYSLRTPDGNYCCLGVACKVSKLGTFRFEPPAELGLGFGIRGVPFYVVGKKFRDHFDHKIADDGELPTAVMRYYGFRHPNGSYYTGLEHHTLVRRNDSEGYTFDQIANIIESEPEGMFTK